MMGIMIREYLGFDNFLSGSQGALSLNIAESARPQSFASTKALMVDIEGIHVGPTRNFTRYMEQALDSSIKSWTHPYNKPLIMHHNEKDGNIIGRVNSVKKMVKNTLSGTPALLFNVSVPDKDGAEQVNDGRLLTTSIGVTATNVKCSCCGYQITDQSGCPEHERGGIYNREICYWDIYEMEAKEISYVVVPSDPYAKNVKIYSQKEQVQLAEALNGLDGGAEQIKGGSQSMTEEQIKELQDSVVTLQEENEKAATDLAEAKKEATSATAEKEALATELAEAKANLATAEAALTEKESELTSEVELREAAEAQVVALQESQKQELVSTFANLRKLAGKAELSEAAIATRSVESLKHSIEDLQLEISEGVKENPVSVPPAVPDITITESKETDVKKADATSNIDLEEGLANLFSGTASRFGKKF